MEQTITDRAVLYLHSIVSEFLEHPEVVRYEEKEDDRGIYIVVRTDSIDMGRMIGRKGETANALRSIMHLWGKKNGRDVSLRFGDQKQ